MKACAGKPMFRQTDYRHFSRLQFVEWKNELGYMRLASPVFSSSSAGILILVRRLLGSVTGSFNPDTQ